MFLFPHKKYKYCRCVSGLGYLWLCSLSLSYIICGSFQGTLQQFVDDFFRSVLCSGAVVPPAVKYFFDFLDEQALKHCVDEETVHIWKTNR